MEDAVNDIDGDLSAVQFSELAHCKLQLGASGIFSEIIKREECAFCVRESFVYRGKLAGVGNNGVIGGGNVAAFKDILNE